MESYFCAYFDQCIVLSRCLTLSLTRFIPNRQFLSTFEICGFKNLEWSGNVYAWGSWKSWFIDGWKQTCSSTEL